MARAAGKEEAIRAALYAAVHRGTPGDVELYLAACAGVTRVLELGCGAGRIAIPLARAGHEVVGIDVDPALLAIARRRARRLPAEIRARLALREGDMRVLSPEVLGGGGDGRGARGPRFERVVIAHSTLYCLESDDDVRAVLRGVRACLAPGGRLVIDAYAADALHASFDPAYVDPLEEIVRVRAAGRRWRVLERAQWDRDAQRLEVLYRHVPIGGGRAIDTTIVHRYLRAAQLEALLRAEGFAEIRLARDFDGAPYGAYAAHMVVTAAIPRRARRRA